MSQVYISRSATLGDVSPQVDLGFDGTAGIERVGHLQQSQFGDTNPGGVGEPQQLWWIGR